MRPIKAKVTTIIFFAIFALAILALAGCGDSRTTAEIRQDTRELIASNPVCAQAVSQSQEYRDGTRASASDFKDGRWSERGTRRVVEFENKLLREKCS